MESWKQSGLAAVVVIIAILAGAGLQNWSLEHGPAAQVGTTGSTATATQVTNPSTGIAELDRIIAILTSGDVAAVKAILIETPSPCVVNPRDLVNPPACPPGVAAGTLLPVFRASAGEAVWPNDLEQVLQQSVAQDRTLYGVRLSLPATPMVQWVPAGDYMVVLGDAAQTSSAVYFATSSGVVGAIFVPWMALSGVLDRYPSRADILPLQVAVPIPTPRPTPTPPPVSPATPLTIGSQAVLDSNTVLYYSVGCFACGRPQVPNLYRMFDPADGPPVTDDLFAPLLRNGGYPHSFAADWDVGVLWAILCTTGYCGGEGDPSADATKTLFRSTDGGITWQSVAKLPPNTFLLGPVGSEVLSVAYRQGVRVYQLLPSGAEVPPPPKGDFGTGVVPGQGIVWRGLLPDGSSDSSFYGSDGRLLLRVPASPPYSARWIAKTPGGNLAEWSIPGPQAGDRPTEEMRVGLFDNAGNLSRAWSWGAIGQVGYQWFEVEGEVASQLLYGTVMTPGWFPFQNAGTTDEQLSHGRAFSLEIAFINLGTASVQPVYGPSLNLTSNQNPFAVHMARGAFARVNTPSDCLNLRETGSTTSAILTCLPDGTLVQLLPSPPKDPAPEYLAVQLPDGRTGWVKSEFLQR